jgi:hypothetical protein
MVIERAWEYVQLASGIDMGARLKVIVPAVLAVAAAYALQLDLLYTLEVTGGVTLPGTMLTGIVIGLGSNALHDVLSLVNNLKGR